MRELSNCEADSVGGGLGLPGAILGGIVGAATCAGQAATGSITAAQCTAQIVGGAAVGATGGVSAMAAYVAPRMGFATGMVVGAFEP